jgi:hypothetical protein
MMIRLELETRQAEILYHLLGSARNSLETFQNNRKSVYTLFNDFNYFLSRGKISLQDLEELDELVGNRLYNGDGITNDDDDGYGKSISDLMATEK